MPKIKLQTLVKAPKQIIFDLSRSIDLHKISTANTKEEAIKGTVAGLIDLGETVTWRAKHLGIFQTLTSKITAFDSPDYFVDEMVKGIFKRFKHEHIFQDTDEGVLMIDIFDYTSPLGFLGRLADKLFLENYMRGFLMKRNIIIKEFAESDRWEEVLGIEKRVI